MTQSGKMIGILGAGQLGKMLAEAAGALGYQTHIYAPDEDPIAAKVATRFTQAKYDDLARLQTFADSVDVITLEFENVPTAPLATLKTPIYPGVALLDISQHRVKEKSFANALGIPTAPFKAVHNQQELDQAMQDIGDRGILKTCTMGYDGKGQWQINGGSVPYPVQGELIYEGFVHFTKEISVIIARSISGEIQCFEPVENLHKHHILHTTTVPADISDIVKNKAIAMATTLAEHLKLVGLLAVEMFVTSDDNVLMNEMAPRPHNSGHWTLHGCNVSQFEQAIRAITGMKLIKPERACAKVMMTNLIGDDIDKAEALRQQGGHVVLYGKKESRPGRKMGHVTFLSPSLRA